MVYKKRKTLQNTRGEEANVGENKRKNVQEIRQKKENRKIDEETENAVHRQFSVKFLNVQCLTKVKAAELESIIENNTILCLVETHQKWNSVNFSRNVEEVSSMRKMNDRKGGGLMALKKGKDIQMEKQATKNEDLMILDCEIYSVKFSLFLVYLSVNDSERNKSIMAEITQAAQRLDGNYIIVGDFNGHIGIIGQLRM